MNPRKDRSQDRDPVRQGGEGERPAVPRRQFLQGAGLGALALTALSNFREVGQAFAEEVEVGGATYSLGEGVTYLNHASIGTIPLAVQRAHRRYLEICEQNPWLHIWGEAWVEPLAEVRLRAASVLGCDAGEVALTHNTTEAFNLLAQGLPLQCFEYSLICCRKYKPVSRVRWPRK